MGGTAKPESDCGHRLEKCTNCKDKHVAFNTRSVQKTNRCKAAQQIRRIKLGGRLPPIAARTIAMAMGSNSLVLVLCSQGVAQGVGEVDGMADLDKEEETAGEGRDVSDIRD